MLLSFMYSHENTFRALLHKIVELFVDLQNFDCVGGVVYTLDIISACPSGVEF